jgi:alkanesulfonate monooxygenase SsuD/methylene tetrahydromethanopterin reductase-like flavin-dependent oxidoreductase (luciferase family)
MSDLSVGCVLPRLAGLTAPQRRRLIERAEGVGLDHLGVGDHVSFYVGAGLDGLLGAAGVLSVAERISANTAVYLLPLRHPVTVARQLADIAVMAPGRFTFGVGIGGEDPHEVQICGVDPATRGRRMDESLQIVRSLLTGEPVDFDGEHFTLEGAHIVPAPSVPIPIVVGGRSDAALRRAGRFGDGWFGIWVSAARYAQAVSTMMAAAADAGRSETPWRNALNVWVGVDNTRDAAREHVAPAMTAFYGIPYERFERWSPAGSTEDIADFLVPYVEAGCQLFNLVINGRDRTHEIEAAAAIRERLRAAVASGSSAIA